MREGFVTAFGAHGERRKLLAANFLPRRTPKCRQIVIAAARNHARHGIERHAEDALDSRDCFLDRKSTLLNSSHGYISYAVFCLKKKNKKKTERNISTSYIASKK